MHNIHIQGGIMAAHDENSSYDDSSNSPRGRVDSSSIIARKNNFAHLTSSNMKVLYN
jgi:hypothetical protein